MNAPTTEAASNQTVLPALGAKDRGNPNAGAKGDALRQSRHIQELMEQADKLSDPVASALVEECIRSLLEMYGDGLARILQLLKNAGAGGESMRNDLAHDKLVRGLLLIHGLHPQSLDSRLHEALDKIRPYLLSHGGNVELVRLEGETAQLRLQGACKTCPSSAITLELAVRQAIEEACPDLAGFEVVGAASEPEPSAPGPCIASR